MHPFFLTLVALAFPSKVLGVAGGAARGEEGTSLLLCPMWTEVRSKASVRFGHISFDLMAVCAFFFFSPGCPCSLGLLNPLPSFSPFSIGSYKQAKREPS